MRAQCMVYKTKECTYGSACPRAHICMNAHPGESLRTPWENKCVRVIHSGTRVIIRGCGGRHMFQECPYLAGPPAKKSVSCINVMDFDECS
jgi:hypothetical protein